uniref:Integrin, alpha 3b n=1 Tax=Takifugu rubripes TaxID=31033 RepID=A0A674ML96_TAKRU
MSPRLLLSTLLVVFYGTQTCAGFNIDERFPVIKEGKTSGSFFGFSVAQHKQTVGSTKYLLLVGAPKEKALFMKNVNETGGVYTCPITADPTDCTRMDLVGSATQSEMVEGMWLGVTVASQRVQTGGRVLACGHRYVKITLADWRMIGKCYVRGNDLTFDPLDEWQEDKYEVCNPNFNMELEGMCNMGISAGMTDTDVYIGATGSYHWQGNVHVTWRDPENSWDSVVKDFGQLKKTHSYMGYSVLEEKKVRSRDDYTVLTGSPRYESKGAVMFGTKNNRHIALDFTIPGEQVGSYFGNSLAVTDLNNDDWNDLIVGAPFYFDRMKDQGGAVYIFMNENGSFRETATLVLKGPSNSAFGLAVAAVGDINQDGFQDFAVGAPFQDTGRVYIWLGSDTGISEQHSQVIEGKTLGNGGFKTFGYSINGGMDMDGNSYPDILVGSLDDRIALLRARPVVHLTTDFTVEPKIVDPNQCPANTPCITATLCMSFTLSNGNKDFKKDITVNYTIEADTGRKRSPRVRFQDNLDDTFTGSLSLPSSKSKCQTVKLNVLTPVMDKLKPVDFSLSVSLSEPKPKSRRSLQNLDSYPILSHDQKLSEIAEINFQKECGTDNKCSSNLQVSARFIDENNNGKFQVLQLNSSVKIIRLKIEVTNVPSTGKLAEDAHQAALNVTIPDALRYSGVRSEDHDVQCSFEETLICELGNPLKGNEKVSVDLPSTISFFCCVSSLSEQADLRPVTVVPRKHISAMVNTSDIGSLVEFTFDVNLIGQPLGELGTLAVEFNWPFEVANGKWLLYLTKIVVSGQSEMECNPPGNVVNPLNVSFDLGVCFNSYCQTSGTAHAQTVLYECGEGTARCVTFSCPLLNMTDSAKIHVRSRLWNGTMLEDYPNALRVTVKGTATLMLITNNPSIKMESQNISCGFFQRANRREMYEAKAQKAEMKIQPSETERLTEDY